jgi:hypothetical protein
MYSFNEMLIETIKGHLLQQKDQDMNFIELIGQYEFMKDAAVKYGEGLKEDTQLEDFMIFNRVCGFLDCSMVLLANGKLHVSAEQDPFE